MEGSCSNEVHKYLILSVGRILKNTKIGSRKKIQIINLLYDQYQDGTMKKFLGEFDSGRQSIEKKIKTALSDSRSEQSGTTNSVL